MAELDDLKKSVLSAITLLEAGQMELPEFINKFKSTLDIVDDLKRAIKKLTKDKEALEESSNTQNDFIRQLNKQLEESNTRLKPQELVEKERQDVEEKFKQYEQSQALWEIEKKYILRESMITKDVLSSILTKTEIKERIWTEDISNPTGRDQYNNTLYGHEKAICHEKNEVTTVPNFNPKI